MPNRKTYKDKIRELVELETNESTGLQNNKVSKFAYTQTAYESNDAKGVTIFDVQKDQNIPEATSEAMEVNETIINKGYRTQSIALGRMIMNHFFGRTSYNLNKIHDFFTEFMKNFMTQFANHAIWDLQALDTNEATDFDTMIESGTYKGEDFISTTAYPEWFDQNGGPSQYGKWSCVVECGKGYRRQYLHYTRIAGAPELQGNYTAIRTMTETPEGDIDDYGTWTCKSVEADHSLLADTSADAKQHIARKDNPHGVTTTQIGAVPKERKVNNHPLTSDVTVTKGDVGLGNVPNWTFETFWTNVKSKIATVLGLTKDNYGGTSAKATSDSANHNIANTYMPRGIDFKSGPIKTLGNGSTDMSEYTWTATEDCFVIVSGFSSDSRATYLKVDGVKVFESATDGTSFKPIVNAQLPIKKGQVVEYKNGWGQSGDIVTHNTAKADFYRYLY